MATKTSTLKLVIAGDNKGAVKSIEGTEKSLGGLQGKLGGLGAGLAGAFSVGAVVAFGKASVSAYSDIAGSVAQIKRLTGDSAEDSSLLAFAAQQSGISADKAAVGWRTLAKNIDSGKVAAEGIATHDQNGRLLEYGDILGNIADRIQALPPGFQRTALAQKLFGKSGADMVKVLQNGRQGIEDLRSEMQSYGLEFNDAGLKKYQDFVKAQRDMKAALSGVQVEVAEKVVPALTAAGNAFAWLGQHAGPVRDTATNVALLGTATAGLVLAVGALGPAFTRGIELLHLKSAADVTATGTTGALAAAQTVAAEAAAAEALASAQLQSVLTSETATQAEVTVALEAKTAATAQAVAADEALAAAEATATTAAAGLVTKLTLVQTAGLVALAAVDKIHAPPSLSDYWIKNAKDAEFTQAKIEQLFKLVGDDRLDEFLKAVGDKSPETLAKFRDALGSAYDPTSKLGKAIDAAAKKADGATDAVAGLTTQTEQYISVQDRVASTVKNSLAYTGELTDAYTAHDDAVQGVTDANADLKASEVAVGEAKAQAAEDQRQATEAVGDAEDKVADAQRSAADAQRDLNDERAQAIRDLIAYHQAAVEAADDAISAGDAAARAAEKARRAKADPRSSPLDRAEAEHEATAAQHEATDAQEKARQAAEDNAKAQAAGVEGDRDVVKAREAVTTANKGVTDAEHDLAKARENVGRVEQESAKKITAARAEVVKSIQKTRDAAAEEAKTWGDLVGKQFGAVAGLQAYRDKLKALSDDLDPNSPLAQRIERLQAEIARAIELARQQAGDQTTAPTRDPDRRAPNQPGDSLNRATGGSLRGGGVTIIQHLHGTPKQANRAAAAASTRVLDKIARGTR